MSDHTPHTAIEARRLGVQFEDLAKQEHAARFGMWIFIGSEVLLFAALFGLYAAYRTEYALEFEQAMGHNELLIGTLNTVILIISSFTIAWSIHALRRERRRSSILMLIVTLACGALFLVFKGIEYSHHFAEGIYPGAYYSFAELPSHGARLFFTLYYFMTGLHALHMLGGLAVVTWLLTRVVRRRATSRYNAELEMGALYWHLVDSIWIFLWPLFYLTG